MSSGEPKHAASPGTTQGKGEQTRRAILDAAIARFGRDGYRATTVAEIARDAGVGGTVTYAYFPNKEALFLAALDEDAAGVISKGVVVTAAADHTWDESLMITLVQAVDEHPLAKRVLSGLEPHVTDRMLEIPALAELRKAVAERLAEGQVLGLVRTDIDPGPMATGVVTIMLALLMSVLQFGEEGSLPYARDVLGVFKAAIDPPGGRP